MFVWECFSYNGEETLQSIEGMMDKYQYIYILANDVTTSSTKMMINDFVFQQDNDPKHASKYAKDYSREIWTQLSTYGHTWNPSRLLKKSR